MERLKNKILTEGKVLGEDILKVDGFLNHQIDVNFLEEMGEEIARRFKDIKIDRVLTVETGGISIACEVSKKLGYVPVVFAKKSKPNTMVEGCYSSEARSFTKGTVSNLRVVKEFLPPNEKVLIVDDFLASGEAAAALVKMVKKAEAEVAGVAVVIEKCFQGGGERLKEQGVRVEALAPIEAFEDGKPKFRK